MFQLHENLPKYLSREHLDEVEIPDIDLTNYDNATLGMILHEKVQNKFSVEQVQQLMSEVPADHRQILGYLDQTALDV